MFLVFSAVVAVVLTVLPMASPPRQILLQQISPDSGSSTFDWNLEATPDTNWTGHLIFDTVSSLLQHWPNTRHRNGHNIVPGSVPVGTLLYHGRGNNAIPTLPEWTATNPEHSFTFCWDSMTNNGSIAGCWQLTFVTVRPLRVLYFDGSSGAKMENGPMDAQDLLLWGTADPARRMDERERINDLCAWGKYLGIDGYVRMEMDFEVMVCDFSNGVELLSADYLSAWMKESAREPLIFGTILSGSWHGRYPGETRVHLDLTKLISFYDTSLTPSLIPDRESKERWDHRVLGISAPDLAVVKRRLQDVLGSGTNMGSGVDWKTLYRVVVDRYADRLETLDYLLDTTTTESLHERAPIIQTELRIMLTPYILYTTRPSWLSTAGSASYVEGIDEAWALPVWRACATRHTEHIHKNSGLQSRLTSSERLLLGALDGTNREICRVLVRMWATGVHAGLDALLPGKEDSSTLVLSQILKQWRTHAHSLIAWLDWSVWVKCRPTCPAEEICYLPTWPYFGVNEWDRKDEQWKRPQPRCIRKFQPYSVLT
ncbi:hypothetical protein MSAN_01702300 [Mycena sanguinolenta]|uniref:Uncharacterized protein n=1 Tax=Mycena sanguinolenta TaxID=230812 RepID=A0A8H7CWC9_9AGAR|nr:hypothetical protein MSAN_01702300 [Mycena sanguinolenta]